MCPRAGRMCWRTCGRWCCRACRLVTCWSSGRAPRRRLLRSDAPPDLRFFPAVLPKLVAIAGIIMILAIVWDAFEALVLPRTANRPFRPARLFYRGTWPAWLCLAHLVPRRRRENFLAIFGPLSFLLLMACWATVQWGLGSHLNVPQGTGGFWTDLYMSGTTLFTLGIGDVTPSGAFARALTVVEAGVGFGFLALVIGYLPVLYQSFSRREVNISLLDARAGSPPSAG